MSYSRRAGWYGIEFSVVNVGFRPVILERIGFEESDGSGYLNGMEDKPDFPVRLEDGEQVVFSFHAEDIEPGTTTFAIRDIHRREHRLPFTQEIWDDLRGFQEFVEESEPQLAAKGRERLAPQMRKLREGDPKIDR
jgi:hypothetical protein